MGEYGDSDESIKTFYKKFCQQIVLKSVVVSEKSSSF